MITREDIQEYMSKELPKELLANPNQFDLAFRSYMIWLTKNYESMNQECQTYVDRLNEEVFSLYESNFEKEPDSPEKRQKLRALAGVKGEHFMVSMLLSILESPPQKLDDWAIEVRSKGQNHLQNAYDLLFDLKEHNPEKPVNMTVRGLLFGCIDELLTAIHLASHRFCTQAGTHIRTVLEILDQAELFHREPNLVQEWADDDSKKAWNKFRPSEIRKKLGEPPYDPIYSYYSEHYSHSTFRWFQTRTAMKKDPESSGTRTATVWVGGSLLKHHLVWIWFGILFTIMRFLFTISIVGVRILNEKESERFVQEAFDSLEWFSKNHFAAWAKEVGFDIADLEQSLIRFRKEYPPAS